MYKLLVIEDEELIRKGIVSLINYEKLNIQEVFEAENGKKALDIIDSKMPDIILSDINIPQLDGISLAKIVKEKYPDTRIVFLTGYDYFDYALSAIKIGADDYILKPVSKKDVEEILTKLVSKLEKKRREEKAIEERKKINISEYHSRSLDEQIGNEYNVIDIEKVINEEIFNPDLSLGYLSEKLGFSVNYLSTLIKKRMGINFQDYVTKNRIEYAKILLLTTDMKIYEIAEKIGYEDVNYFSSRFKYYVGQTPRQYQREVSS